jgi:CheY-like chemotaxis protein
MKRILVVDDDPATCAAATGILNALEYTVEIVPDAGSALKRLRARVPDAVLVDGGGVVAALQPLLWERTGAIVNRRSQ